LTEAAKSQTGGNGIDEGKGIEQKPLPLRSEVARAIRQTVGRKATGPDDVPVELFKGEG